MENNNRFLKDYLQLEHPYLIKSYLWVCIIVVNFFVLGISFVPHIVLNMQVTKFVFSISLILIIFLDIWAFYIMMDPNKRQKQYTLFTGLQTLIASIILLVVALEFIGLLLGFYQYILPLIIIYILILVLGFRFHKKALKTGYYYKKGGKNSKSVAIISTFAVLGTIFGKVLARSANQGGAYLILGICSLLLSYILELGTHNLYKYYLINKYEEYVELYELPKKDKSKKKTKRINAGD
ncbi:hypothetical protein [Caloramator australicus]|uniref:Uncharacterized protein n=1 Tax=Caloramator australicus RC3 TaxID=857293 RepID=I7J5G2_9CLOT|nr:hypothetical protein [Caloramator australicus]CCJ33731.1 hypothetical protein CAAU_1647 [Caloramator australicus RC3]